MDSDQNGHPKCHNDVSCRSYWMSLLMCSKISQAEQQLLNTQLIQAWQIQFVYHHNYRVPHAYAYREMVESELKEMLDNGIFENFGKPVVSFNGPSKEKKWIFENMC